MNKVRTCVVENCIPTPSSCVTWNGGDIEFLGICQGDNLNNLLWEILDKLKNITGDDLSGFDIDSLTTICQEKAPHEITILSILNMVKTNQLCLKEYIDKLDEKLGELFQDDSIDISLRCLSDLDNVGNNLITTRKSLDQAIVNQICEQKNRIKVVEEELSAIKTAPKSTSTTGEKSVPTCLDEGVKPVSTQLQTVASAFCDLISATGNSADISGTLSLTPENWQQKYGGLLGWQIAENLAEQVANHTLIISNLETRLSRMETGCCALSCDDIKLGFSASFNEDMTSVILRFTSGAGTSIPTGFIDKGSLGTIKDSDGNVETFALGIHNDLEEEVYIYNLSVKGDVVIDIIAKIGNESLTCEKLISKTIKASTCAYCEITAEGEEGSSAVLVISDPSANTTETILPISQSLPTTTIPI